MHTVTIIKREEIPVKYIRAIVEPRYWEDAVVNNVKDENGTLMPFRKGDIWDITIELDSGVIENWPVGTTAKVHYKVCDAGQYSLLDAEKNVVKEIDRYVPNIMCPKDNGYGDYIIMDISETGLIDKWRVCLKVFDDREGEW